MIWDIPDRLITKPEDLSVLGAATSDHAGIMVSGLIAGPPIPSFHLLGTLLHLLVLLRRAKRTKQKRESHADETKAPCRHEARQTGARLGQGQSAWRPKAVLSLPAVSSLFAVRQPASDPPGRRLVSFVKREAASSSRTILGPRWRLGFFLVAFRHRWPRRGLESVSWSLPFRALCHPPD